MSNLFLVGTGIGIVELLSLKSYTLITTSANIVFSKRAISQNIQKIINCTANIFNYQKNNKIIVKKFYFDCYLKNENIIHLLAGDACIFESLNFFIDLANNIGLNIEIIPSISAYQYLASKIMLDLMPHNISQSFVISNINNLINNQKTIHLHIKQKNNIVLYINNSNIFLSQLIKILNNYELLLIIAENLGCHNEKIIKIKNKNYINIIDDIIFTRLTTIIITFLIEK